MKRKINTLALSLRTVLVRLGLCSAKAPKQLDFEFVLETTHCKRR
jgi:hypothetical protein